MGKSNKNEYSSKPGRGKRRAEKKSKNADIPEVRSHVWQLVNNLSYKGREDVMYP